MNRRRRVVTPDEARVWRSVVRDVKPLAGHGVEDEPAEPAPVPTPDAATPRPDPVAPARPSAAHVPMRTVLPSLAPGRAPGLDRRSAERLKGGEMQIDGRLDLHGMTQDAAHANLLAFVGRAYDAGRRCVLVITGKGRGGEGVLRSQVPRWLNQSPVRERILGFTPAQPRHGGDGAFYVLVKRRRA